VDELEPNLDDLSDNDGRVGASSSSTSMGDDGGEKIRARLANDSESGAVEALRLFSRDTTCD
jgi:hypothetical protein